MDVLYKTIHGSKLYGLSHENSDDDFYTVVSKVKNNRATYSKQKIIGSEDSVVVDFGTWLDQCRKGVPQALEAMFSDMALVDKIPEFRAGYKASTGVYETYLRTIKNFCLSDDYKKKRHGLRLGMNLCSIRECGRFNPTLSAEQREIVSGLANLPDQYVYDWALKFAWS